MPTYDYKCAACSHAFEQFQSMKDKPLRKCPKCGKHALERLIGTGGAIIFKGGGFYQTDYRSESYKKAAEADSKPANDAKPADATASTSDAKPAGKPDATPTKKPDATPAPSNKSAGSVSTEPKKSVGKPKERRPGRA